MPKDVNDILNEGGLISRDTFAEVLVEFPELEAQRSTDVNMLKYWDSKRDRMYIIDFASMAKMLPETLRLILRREVKADGDFVKDITEPYLKEELVRAERKMLEAEGPYNAIKHRVDNDEVKRIDALHDLLDDAWDRLTEAEAEHRRCIDRLGKYAEEKSVLKIGAGEACSGRPIPPPVERDPSRASPEI